MGRVPKGEYAGKSSVFSTRISPELRTRLEKATKQSGRSLSQEVEHRLRRSFEKDDQIVELFGDRQTYRLMRMMADAINFSCGLDFDESWMDQPITFALAKEAINAVLDRVAPNRPDTWNKFDEFATKFTGGAIAKVLWTEVIQADDALPLKGTNKKYKAAVAKADLSKLLERVISAAHDEEVKKRIAEVRQVLAKGEEA
jgi:hypothetical protein